MNFLGIIPARSGSKSIKNKNIVELNGKPLIYYTIKAAKKSFLKDNFIVSTDDNKIIEICKKFESKICSQKTKEIFKR